MKLINLKVILFTFVLVACAQMQNVQSGSLEVMVYNVENLFDAEHDEGKNDFTFLPKSFSGKMAECSKISYKRYRKQCEGLDWTKKGVALKIEQIKKVILARAGERKNKSVPEVLALVEVENEKAVKLIADSLGYKKVIVSSSPDKRGIDVALLVKNESQAKVLATKEMTLKDEYFIKKPTRNILEVSLKIAGKHDLTIFINHWPSLGNPTSTRLVAAKAVRERILALKAKNKEMNFMVVGDFNTIAKNHPHPFHTHFFHDQLLTDLHTAYKKDRKIPWHVKNARPLGTYFYSREMQWNVLDRIFYGKNLQDNKGLELDYKSYQIFAAPFMTTSYIYQKTGDYLVGSQVNNIPKRYDHKVLDAKKQGFSDHFPILVQLKF